MEQDFYQEITAKIKDKSYYQDAKEWYCSRYLFPVVERTYAFFLCLLCLCTTAIMILNVYILFPFSAKVPFVIEVNNITDYYTTLTPLTKNDERPEEAIAYYLINHFIHTWEDYNFQGNNADKIKANIQKLKKMAVKDVVDIYQPYLDNTLIKYGSSKTRTINVTSFQILQATENSTAARILFTATVRDTRITPPLLEKTQWEATVEYYLPAASLLAKATGQLHFSVISYRSRQLS